MTPRTVAYNIPPSMGLSRQEYWNGVPLPSPIPRAEGLKQAPQRIREALLKEYGSTLRDSDSVGLAGVGVGVQNLHSNKFLPDAAALWSHFENYCSRVICVSQLT